MPIMSTHVRDLVALAHAGFGLDEASLKQLALMFNRIALAGLPVFVKKNPFDPPGFAENRAWLVETGIVFDPSKEKLDPPLDPSSKTFDLIREDANNILGPSYGVSLDDMMAARKDEAKAAQMKEARAHPNPDFAAGNYDVEKFMDTIKRMSMTITRAATIQLRKAEKIDAYATIPSAWNALDRDDDRATKHDIVKIVLTVPVPDESVSWQQIVDYRSDPDCQNDFFDLKEWMSDVGRGSIAPADVAGRLEFLLDRYRWHLGRHQLSTNWTTLEAFIVTTAETVEKFGSFRRGQSASPLFSLEHRELGLLEGESTSAGSVVAFVITTKSMFEFPSATTTQF